MPSVGTDMSEGNVVGLKEVRQLDAIIQELGATRHELEQLVGRLSSFAGRLCGEGIPQEAEAASEEVPAAGNAMVSLRRLRSEVESEVKSLDTLISTLERIA